MQQVAVYRVGQKVSLIITAITLSAANQLSYNFWRVYTAGNLELEDV